jgi:hypothetical protein
MQEEGVVSLWVGHVNSEEALDAYLLTRYSEDGDLIPSPFARDFRTGYYDEDFREAQYYESPSRSIRELLRGFSYDDVIIPKFVQLFGELLAEEVNAVVCLYNFRHEGGVEPATGGAARLQYMGAITLG